MSIISTSESGGGKRRGVMMGAGVCSLIIIFVALSISIFSVLSLVTVRRDLDSAKRLNKAQEEYYAADSRAVETLYIILNKGEIPDSVTISNDDEGTHYSWSESINDNQELSCKVLVQSDGKYRITAWQTKSTAEFIIDESLPVWDGNNIPG